MDCGARTKGGAPPSGEWGPVEGHPISAIEAKAGHTSQGKWGLKER
jgi:hypothetical protein